MIFPHWVCVYSGATTGGQAPGGVQGHDRRATLDGLHYQAGGQGEGTSTWLGDSLRRGRSSVL